MIYFTGEEGIIDLIYEYSCGIGLRQLQKIIYENFTDFKLTERTLQELTNYLSLSLSRGIFDIEDQVFNIKIFIRRISIIISGRKSLGMRLLYRHNHEHSLYSAINNTIKDVEIKTKKKYSILFYG